MSVSPTQTTRHDEIFSPRPKENLEPFIRRVFREVVENPVLDMDAIERYFSKKYVQYVDGKTLTYDDFVAHMRKQKSLISKVKITIERFIQEGDQFSTVHYAEGVKSSGQKVKAKVIAHFEVSEGQIILCDELTHLIEGEKEDQDLGSRC